MIPTNLDRWLQQKYKYTTYFVAICILLISTYLSLLLSDHMAISKEINRLKLISTEMHARLFETRIQFAEVVTTFSKDIPSEVCSKQQIEKMQEHDVAAIFLQAVGYMKNNVIQCSSYSPTMDGLNLGSPINTEEDGTRVWINVDIPHWKKSNFVFYERLGWTVLIDPQHAIVALGDPKVTVGIFGIRSHTIFTARGKVYSEWLNRYKKEESQTFIDSVNNKLVYLTPAELGRSAIIAALPLEEIQKANKEFAKLFLPIGISIGLVLSFAFILLAKKRVSPKNIILKALINDEFYMEYQPILDLDTNACVGAEGLIRWKSYEGNVIMPDFFIPVAEATGLMCQITAHVFKLVAMDMQTVFQQYPDIQIGINITAQDLLSGNLLELIEEFKTVGGAKSSQLVLEATERGLVNDAKSLQVMKEIRRQGVKIAIDDFGTGYSNLSYLTKFELDYIKIDKSFVDSVGTEAVTRHVAFHIIEMAKSLNLGMVAEGVETEIQAKLLSEKGVKYVQGWLFSKALSASNFETYLEKNAN